MSDSRPAKVSRAAEANDHVLRNEIYELFKECQNLRETLSAEMDENDRLRAENERLRAENSDDLKSELWKLTVEARNLRIENKALRQDAERYRWVRKARENFDVLARNSEDERWYDLFGDYLDDYIDAAMKREGHREIGAGSLAEQWKRRRAAIDAVRFEKERASDE